MMPPGDLNLFIKCLGMLGSDHEGEAANARAMCNRLLKKHKLTWADVPKLQAAAGASNAEPSQEAREWQDRQAREAAAREAAEETARAKQAYEDARRREEAVTQTAAEAARKAAKERRQASRKNAVVFITVVCAIGAMVVIHKAIMGPPQKPDDPGRIASVTPFPPNPATLKPVNGDPFAKGPASLSFDQVKNDQFRVDQYVQPTTVSLPDGTLIDFPAGLTGNEIVAAIEKKFPSLAQPPAYGPPTTQAPASPSGEVHGGPPERPASIIPQDDQCTPAALKLREAGSGNTCHVLNRLALKECVVTLGSDYGNQKKGGSFQAVNYNRLESGNLEICSRSGGCVPKEIVNSITACPNGIPTYTKHPASAGPYEIKVDPPICETVIVDKVFIHNKDCDDASYGKADPKTGEHSCYGAGASGINYVGGKAQNGGYAVVPAMEASLPGDKVRLCLIAYMANCPPGDNRGKFYSALNLRTHGRWVKADSMHMCGGA